MASYVVPSGETSTGLNLTRDTLNVLNGGSAVDTHVNSAGGLYVSSGGEAYNTIVNSAGELDVYYEGMASGVVVSAGASVFVASDGSAFDIKEEGGRVSWSNGATVTFVPSVFTNYTFQNGYGATIHSGTTANCTTLNRGFLYVYNGGLVTETKINGGGGIYLSSGAEARDTIVTSAGEMIASYGGRVNGCSVSSGGYLTVSSGGSITGRLTVQNGAKVTASTGAIIDFDLTRATVGDAALINNLSLINGAPVFTLTASGNVEAGNYILAGGASGFNKSITIYDSESFYSYGVFTTGESVRVGNLSYTLSLSGTDLVVSVEEIPPDYVAPTVSNIKASTTALTNQNVVLTAVFADDVALAASLYRLGTDGAWTPYTNGVTVTANTTVYFKAVDAAGNESMVESYKVDNIDKEAPAAPTASANITESTTGTVTVTAVFSQDSVLREYSYDRVDWRTYTTGIQFNSNNTVYFRGTDAAGNVSTVTSYTVSNIEEVEKGADLAFYWVDDWYSKVMVAPTTNSDITSSQTLVDHDYLYLNFANVNWGDVWSDPYAVDVYLDGDFYRRIYRDSLQGGYYETKRDVNIGSFGVGLHDVELRVVNENDGDPEDNVYSTSFYVYQDAAGSFEKSYYGGSTEHLDCEATLSLKNGRYTVTGNFIGSQTGKKVNAKIVIYNSRNKKIGTINVKKGKVAYKDFVLTSDTYTVYVLSTDKQKSADRVTFNVVGDVFYKADLNDNCIDDVKDRYPFIATVLDVPSTLISAGWVGFGDVLSFRQVEFEYAGKYKFTINSSDKVKVSLISVTYDSKGRSKEKTVVSTSVSGKKLGKDVEFGGNLLNSGTYYLRVEALNAAKGTDADYSVKISSSSVIFSAGDTGSNDWLYNSKTKTLNKAVSNSQAQELTPDSTEVLFDKTPAGDNWGSFVGYGDEADYVKIHLSNSSTLSFDVNATGAVKFTVYSLSAGKKAGTYNMKSLQSTTFKPGKGKNTVSGETKLLALSAGDYYLCMESTDAKKGGSAYYNVAVDVTSLVADQDEFALTGPEKLSAFDDSSLADFAMQDVLSGIGNPAGDLSFDQFDSLTGGSLCDGSVQQKSIESFGNGILASV